MEAIHGGATALGRPDNVAHSSTEEVALYDTRCRPCGCFAVTHIFIKRAAALFSWTLSALSNLREVACPSENPLLKQVIARKLSSLRTERKADRHWVRERDALLVTLRQNYGARVG